MRALLKAWGHNIPEQWFNIGVKRFTSLDKGEINMEEFEKEMTYLMLECGFEELSFKPLPTPPQEMEAYYQLDREARKKMKEEFWYQYPVKAYVEERKKIEHLNMASKVWFEENLSRLETYGDFLNAQKIKEKLNEYE